MTDDELHLRASDVFKQAIDLPASERESFLISECDGDVDLLNEVRSLLAHDAPEFEKVSTADLPDAFAPKKFGRYEIQGQIGHGGMGIVYKAWDPHLARHVALKFLPDTLSRNEAARRRFLREGRAASRLKHDGIATVFEAGEIDGRSYIAFEFVDGDSVTHRLESGPFPSAEAVRVAIAAAKALAHAHERSVFHRDVTSNNIMITQDGNVVIVDFGLALAKDSERLTRSGSTVGTIAYMSPEALAGFKTDDNTANARSDLYGLGITLYEMLTASLPFQAQALHQLMYVITNVTPEPPSKLVAALPTELDAAVLRALEKDPARRYSNVLEFADALEMVLRSGGLPEVSPDKAIVRRPPVSTEPWSHAPRRHGRRFLIAATACAALALAVLLLWRFQSITGKPAFASVAVLPIDVTGPDTDVPDWLTSGIGRETVAKLSKLPGVRVVTWISSRRFHPGEKSLREIAKDLGVESLVTVSLQRQNGRFHGTVELVNAGNESVHAGDHFDEAEGDLFSIESRIAGIVAKGMFGDVSRAAAGMLATPAARSVEAYEHYLRGAEAMQTDTPESNSTALAYFQRALELDPNLADAMVGVGAVHVNRYFFGWEGGIKNLEIATRYFSDALSIEPSNRDALRGMIEAAYEESSPVEALKLGARADASPAATVDDLITRSTGYILGGLAPKAQPLLRRVLATEPTNQAAAWWLVIADNWARHYDECIRDAETFFEKFGDDAEVHLWAATSHWALADTDAAVVHFRRAFDLYGDHPNDYAPILAIAFYRSVGMSEEADHLLPTSIVRLERVVAAYPDNTRYFAGLTSLYAFAGDANRFLENASIVRQRSNSYSRGAYLAIGYCVLGLAGVEDILCRAADTGDFTFYGNGAVLMAGGCLDRPAVQVCLDKFARNAEELSARY